MEHNIKIKNLVVGAQIEVEFPDGTTKQIHASTVIGMPDVFDALSGEWGDDVGDIKNTIWDSIEDREGEEQFTDVIDNVVNEVAEVIVDEIEESKQDFKDAMAAARKARNGSPSTGKKKGSGFIPDSWECTFSGKNEEPISQEAIKKFAAMKPKDGWKDRCSVFDLTDPAPASGLWPDYGSPSTAYNLDGQALVKKWFPDSWELKLANQAKEAIGDPWKKKAQTYPINPYIDDEYAKMLLDRYNSLDCNTFQELYEQKPFPKEECNIEKIKKGCKPGSIIFHSTGK